MLTLLQTTIPDALSSILTNLPTAAAMFYVWYVSNTAHAKEREEWRAEIKSITEALKASTEQLNKLTYIIENHVFNKPKDNFRG
ncbi:MAG: hypothetical protein RR555_05510 [Bacteroidales bacterium]